MTMYTAHRTSRFFRQLAYANHHLHTMLNMQLSGINREGRNNEASVYAQVIFSLVRSW